MSDSLSLDRLYLFALLYDAPAMVKQELLGSQEIPADWPELCRLANRMVLGTELERSEKVTALRSIFSLLRLPKYDPPKANYWFQPAEMLLNDDFFPIKDVEAQPFDELWAEFIKAAAPFAEMADKYGGEMVLQLLHKYTATIPCDYIERDTVCYYDLARLRAGVVIALAKGGDKVNNKVLMLGGDVSGIQKFLYDIVSKNASRNLKGRSFYLYILVNNIIEDLLDRLDLYQGNIVYDSGGNFLLIVPNTEEVREKIRQFEEEISKALFEQHKTTITFAFGTTVFGRGDTLREMFSEIGSQQRKKKQQPFKKQVEEYSTLFDPEEVEKGGISPRDVITGEEIPVQELTDDVRKERACYFDPNNIEDIRGASKEEIASGKNLISYNSATQVILGQRLKGFNYWIKTTKQVDELGRIYIPRWMPVHTRVGKLEIYNYLLTSADLDEHFEQLRSIPLTILQINEFSLPEWKIPPKWKFQFHLYGGNEGPTTLLPLHPNSAYLVVPKTFSEMAGNVEKDRLEYGGEDYVKSELDFKRLGVLRMDVDNLGRLFREGVPVSQTCLANHATLSRNMDYFFKGYLNKLWVQDYRYDTTQIIYAGGDDLFVIGRWDKIYHFARSINRDFARWTGFNPAISISGGMVVVTHKYPVMKAADIAGKAEKQSKDYTITTSSKTSKGSIEKKDHEKNAFTVLGNTLRWSEVQKQDDTCTDDTWTDEFALLEQLFLKLKTQLRGKHNPDGIPISILRNLYTLRELESGIISHNKFAWHWQASYALGQLQSRLSKRSQYAEKTFLELIKQFVLVGNIWDRRLTSSLHHTPLSLLALTARLAELDRRTESAILNQEHNNRNDAL
ncbi:hypothetical protein [Lewinella sp. LCG006]|uniref:type III-A CRISPR-associated protein Cas10/Csm1 n=1 Tax=Lewinella sp. LCG006 TaxID=3231911 RepID=UPI00346064C1